MIDEWYFSGKAASRLVLFNFWESLESSNHQRTRQGSRRVPSDAMLSDKNAWSLQTIPALAAWSWRLQVFLSSHNYFRLEYSSMRSCWGRLFGPLKTASKTAKSAVIIHSHVNIIIMHKFLLCTMVYLHHQWLLIPEVVTDTTVVSIFWKIRDTTVVSLPHVQWRNDDRVTNFSEYEHDGCVPRIKTCQAIPWFIRQLCCCTSTWLSGSYWIVRLLCMSYAAGSNPTAVNNFLKIFFSSRKLLR